MLTDLNFLNPGAPWPPEDVDTRERLGMYDANRQLFNGKHARIYKKQFERVERVISNFRDIVAYPIVLNYQKLISLKTADLLFGEKPDIRPNDRENKPQIKMINGIIERSELNQTNYMGAIDVSRYGDGLFLVYKGEKGGQIDITQPSLWFPIVDPMNIKRRVYEVMAWETKETIATGRNKSEEISKLKVFIYDKSWKEEREYVLVSSVSNKGVTIGKMISSKKTKHGLDDFPIVQISNIITSEEITGKDDYGDVESILGELMVRISQVSRVLDKHAAPSVSGPQTSLEKDIETGEWRLKLGNYFPRNTNDEPKPEYMVWEGELSAAFKQVEFLVNQLYIISEMGAALLGDFSNTNSGQVPSGTAMRRMMMSPLAKVGRIRMRFDPAIKKAIALASQLTSGITLTRDEIDINWQDGLPTDPKEQAEIEKVRTGGKATSSQQSSIQRLDNISEDGALEEYERIITDEEPVDPTI